jgi:hypothetical protein
MLDFMVKIKKSSGYAALLGE